MIAFYPGSFNPFTIGHLDIAARALRVADSVIIGVGINPHKESAEIAEARVRQISFLFKDCPRVSVVAYDGLTIEAARRAGADLMIRGFRNASDAEYERNLASTNLLIAGPYEIDTWIIPARPELECISSSMVNELLRFGQPVEAFLPTPDQCRQKCNINR